MTAQPAAGGAAADLVDAPRLAIAMTLLGWLVLSGIDVSVKWLGLLGIHAFQLAFMRYFVHFALAFGAVSRRGLSRAELIPPMVWMVTLRAAILVVSTVVNFIALRYLPLALNTAIMFSAPIVVCLLSAPLLGERVGPWRWSAIVVGFCGVLIVLRPFGEFNIAALLPAFNAVATAFYFILTRKLAGTVNADAMQLFLGGLGTLVLAPLALSVWVTPESAFAWLLLIGIGVLGWGGHQLLTLAHAKAPASILTPFSYTLIVYLTIAGYLVFDEAPDGVTLIGGAVIVLSGLFIWWRERRLEARRARYG